MTVGTPFKPGYDSRRNLTGRPTEAKELMDVLRSQIPYEKIALALDKLVDAGDPGTIKYMVDRHLGTPAQSIQISGDAERPLHLLAGVAGRDLAPQLPSGEAGGSAAEDTIQIDGEAQWVREAHCLDDLEDAPPPPGGHDGASPHGAEGA